MDIYKKKKIYMKHYNNFFTKLNDKCKKNKLITCKKIKIMYLKMLIFNVILFIVEMN